LIICHYFPLPHRAIDSFERSLALLPTYPTALYHLGLVLKATGDHSRALRQFDAALEANPSFR
jgi:lipoprotein NlpI